MELEQLRKQLQQLDRGQLEILGRLEDMAEDVKNTMVEIGGVPGQVGRDPNRQSIRSRLHHLENDRTSAQVAATALDAAKELRAVAAEKRFSRREKLAALSFAGIIAVGPYVAAFINH